MSSTTQSMENEIRELQSRIDSLLTVEPPNFGEAEIRQMYIDNLIDGDEQEAERVARLKANAPISKVVAVNGDEEPVLADMNNILAAASMDFFNLDTKLITATSSYTNLIKNTMERMMLAERRILTERQRLEDINMICSSYKSLSNVQTLLREDFGGNCGYDETAKVFFAMPNSNKSTVKLEVIDISGNGYAGNKYVVRNGDYANKRIDTSVLNNLVDESPLTTFEYSRLCGKTKYNSDVNIDDKSTICTVELTSGDQNINAVRIETSDENIIVKDVLISPDNGRTYYSAFSKRRRLNGDIYEAFDYVNKSNIIAFPQTNYFKIVFESDTIPHNEVLAYEKTTFNEDSVSQQVVQMEGVSRKVISIDNISAFKCTYQKATFESKELIDASTEVNSIAVFSNEYIPDYFISNDYIKYTLVINGEEYEVVPINSNKQGIKLLCYREYSYVEPSMTMLSESIKSAYLRVEIEIPSYESTPFLSNLKICLGD